MIVTSGYKRYEKGGLNIVNIAFLGDSLTDYVRFERYFPEFKTRNYGVEGDTSQDLLNRLDPAISDKPCKVFILIGVNDVLSGLSQDRTLANIRQIVSLIQKNSPESKIYLETLLPVNSDFLTRRSNEAICSINAGIAVLAEEMHCTLVDTHKIFAEDGELPKRFTIDGLHLNNSGNNHWLEFLSKYVKE